MADEKLKRIGDAAWEAVHNHGAFRRDARDDEYLEAVGAAVLAAVRSPASTDDEREALYLIEQAASFREQARPNVDDFPNGMIGLWMRTASALESALRRSEVPEPDADDEHDIEPWSPTGRIDSPVSCQKCDRALFIGAEGKWQHVPRPGQVEAIYSVPGSVITGQSPAPIARRSADPGADVRSESSAFAAAVAAHPGEPSDAQVVAALKSWYGVHAIWSSSAAEGMRAALRAAGGVR